MKRLGIIQARMTSTRLPGKILKTAAGRPLLEHEIARLRRARGIDELVVATTTHGTDDPVIELCESIDVPTYRGSEDDVLDRYHSAAALFGAGEGDLILRFTADCPLIDPEIVSRAIETFVAARGGADAPDYQGIDFSTMPHGTDVEIFTFEALDKAFRCGHDAMDREHVTWYIWHHPETFRVTRYSHSEDLSGLRLTVDTPEDLRVVRAIFDALYEHDAFFTLGDVAAFMREHPEVASINADVKQKHYASWTSNG